MSRSNDIASIVTFASLIVLAAIAFLLPIAIIGFVGFAIYKGFVWYNRKKRLPEINRRYAQYVDLKIKCKSYSDYVIDNASKSYVRDYQKLYNTICYNENYWNAIIEQKGSKEFDDLCNGLNAAVDFQVERVQEEQYLT